MCVCLFNINFIDFLYWQKLVQHIPITCIYMYIPIIQGAAIFFHSISNISVDYTASEYTMVHLISISRPPAISL